MFTSKNNQRNFSLGGKLEINNGSSEKFELVIGGWGVALATWHSWLLGELGPEKWRRTNIERSHHWLNIPNRNPARALTGSRFIPSNLSKFKTWISQEATIEVQFDYITQLCTSHDHVQVDYRTLNNVCFRLFFSTIFFWFMSIHTNNASLQKHNQFDNTWRLRHCEFFHRTGSKSVIPVIVPIYLRTPDSSVSNIILNLIPRETWLNRALLYLANGITNSEGLALLNWQLSIRGCHKYSMLSYHSK